MADQLVAQPNIGVDDVGATRLQMIEIFIVYHVSFTVHFLPLGICG